MVVGDLIGEKLSGWICRGKFIISTGFPVEVWELSEIRAKIIVMVFELKTKVEI